MVWWGLYVWGLWMIFDIMRSIIEVVSTDIVGVGGGFYV